MFGMKNSRHEIQKPTLSKNGRKLLPAVLVTNLLVVELFVRYANRTNQRNRP